MTDPEEIRNVRRVEWRQKERPGPGFLELLGFSHNPLDPRCLGIGCLWVSDLNTLRIIHSSGNI